VRDNKLESCYIRPIAFYGSDAMGVAAKSNPVLVAIAAWPWGAYLGADGHRKGHPREDVVVHAHHPNITMCSAKAVCNYAVSILANQEATHDGYEEAMLLDPQGFVARVRRERVPRARRQAAHAGPSGGALERHHARDDHHARARARHPGASSAASRATSSTSPTKRSSPARGRGHADPRVRQSSDRRRAARPMTAKLQTMFFDTVNGRSAKHREWLTAV
jgi:branched-chain amino acid aminotransferase